MANSNIQQNLSEMLQHLQEKNKLEAEYITLLGSSQENLVIINNLLKENLLLQGKDISQYEKYIEEKRKALEEERDLSKEINQLNEELLKSEETSLDNHKKTNTALSEQGNLYDKIKKSSMAVGAAMGLFSGIGNVISMGFKIGSMAVKSFIDILGKIGGTLFNVGKSLLMLPWNMFKSFVSMAASASGSTELLDAIENIRKEWGSFSKELGNNMASSVLQVSALGMSLKNLAVANVQFYSQSLIPGRSMMRVWQSMAAMIKDVGETLSALGPTINLVIGQFKEVDGSVGQTAKTIIGMQKGLGLAKEEFAALAKVSARSGQDIIDIEYEMGNLSLQLGDKFGISAKKISSDVGKMMKDVDHFGNLSTKQLSAVAAYTAKLGIETGKLVGLMDKFDQFEESAEGASKLSQAFGLQIDSMEMMREEDPAARFDMLRKSMERAGMSTDGMRRQSTKLLATLTGLDAETVRQGFSSKNLGKSYDEVKKAVDEASTKQLDQTQILNRLADAIEKVNRSGQQLKDGFLKSFLDGIQKGVERTPSFINMLTNLKRGLLQARFGGMEAGRSIFEALGLTGEFDKQGNLVKKGVFDTLGEAFGPSEMEKFWRGQQVNVFKGFDKQGKGIYKLERQGGIAGILKDIFDPNSTTKTIDEKINELFNLISNKFTKSIGPDSPLYSSLQKLGARLGLIFQKIIVSIGTKISDIFKSGANWLKGEDVNKELENGVEKAARLAKESPWVQFLSPVWDGLKSAFAGIFDGFAEIAPQIAKKIIEGLTWVFKAVNYFLSSDSQKADLDNEAVKKTQKMYLGGSIKKPEQTALAGGEKSFNEQMSESFTKLSDGMTAVFNDEKLMGSFNNAFDDAWKKLKVVLIEGLIEGAKGAWAYLEPLLGPYVLKYVLGQVAMGFVKGAVSDIFQAGKAAKDLANVAETGADLAKGSEVVGEMGFGAKLLSRIPGGSKLLGGLTTKFAPLAKAAGPLAKFAGPLAAAFGGLSGYMGAEEHGRGKFEGTALGALTGGIETGSFLGRAGFIEQGTLLDKALGVVGAGVHAGTLSGGNPLVAIGGMMAEMYKIQTDKNSKQIEEEKIAAEAQKAQESRARLDETIREQLKEQQMPNATRLGDLPSTQFSQTSYSSIGAGYSAQTQTSQEASSVTQTLNNIQQTIDKTTENVETTKQNLAKNDDNIKKITDASSQTSIDVGNVVVNLKKFEDNMMEGVNSIRKSVQNVNVNVAVAVQLDPKELEKIIVAQKDSLIRKAVSIIENNISPNATPRTAEKNDISGGTIATAAFGNV